MKFSIENLYPNTMVNPKLIEKVIKDSPEWEDIFARVWEI